MKPELSKRNKYYVERYRYYELKYFCMQYPLWKSYLKDLNDSIVTTPKYLISEDNVISDPTQKRILIRERYINRIKMVEQAAFDTDPSLYSYILKGVTEGLSYNILKARFNIPCGRDMYYERYRKFFWLLNKYRDTV